MFMHYTMYMMQLTPQNNQNTTPLFDDIVAVRDDLINNKDVNYTQSIIPGELSDAFAMLDPDLSMLHKDMKTALAQLALAQKSGQMVDIAAWRFETSESAYQTRLMEVRKNKLLSKVAKESIDSDEAQAKKQLHAETMQNRMNDSFNRQRVEKQKKKRSEEKSKGGLFFYLMLGMWLANMNKQSRDRNLGLSGLQTAFAGAKTT